MNMSVSVKGKEVHGSHLLKFGIDLSHAEEKMK